MSEIEAEAVDTTKMSTRGQVIIPKGIRDYIGAEEDTIFTVISLDRETIVMKKLDKKRLINEFRTIRTKTKKISSEEISDEIQAARSKT